MDIKTKKLLGNKVFRMESKGEMKEILVKEDLMHPSDSTIEICFRGPESAGIVELTIEEADAIKRELTKRLKPLKDIKVYKFKK